jgi:hypothetical protein
VLYLCFCRKKMKKRLVIEMAQTAAFTQWLKKVIVEKQESANAQNTQGPLVSYIIWFHFACRSNWVVFFCVIVTETCTVRTFHETVCWRWLLHHNSGAADIVLGT